ncbi:MAG: ribulokinase, partial [Ensifer adhaerens]
CRVVAPDAPDAVLLGTAMAAAVAGQVHVDLGAAGAAMASGGREQLPNAAMREIYDRDYRRFLALYRHRDELDALQ